MADDVADLRAEVAWLRRRLGEVEERLSTEHARSDPAAGGREPRPEPDDPPASDRRGFLALAAGTAVAGAAAVVGTSTPAAAGTGDALVVGDVQSADDVSAQTVLESPSTTTLAPILFHARNWTTGWAIPNAGMRVANYGVTAGSDDSSGFRIGVMGASNPVDEPIDASDATGVGVYGASGIVSGPLPEPPEPVGVYGVSYGAATGLGAPADPEVPTPRIGGAWGAGVKGEAKGLAVVGVHGIAGIGTGVLAESTSDFGTALMGSASGAGSFGVVASAQAPSSYALLVLGRHRQITSGSVGPPTTASVEGEQWRDSNGAMFLCTAPGTPGTWRKVVTQHPDYADAGGSINLLPRPIRVVDTRPTSTAPLKNGGARLAPGTNTTFQITGTTVSGVAVPAGATGVVGNLTATSTQGDGFFSVFAAGLPPTGTSTVNYTDASIANFFLSALSPSGALTVRCGTSAAHCIIDIVGFLA